MADEFWTFNNVENSGLYGPFATSGGCSLSFCICPPNPEVAPSYYAVCYSDLDYFDVVVIVLGNCVLAKETENFMRWVRGQRNLDQGALSAYFATLIGSLPRKFATGEHSLFCYDPSGGQACWSIVGNPDQGQGRTACLLGGSTNAGWNYIGTLSSVYTNPVVVQNCLLVAQGNLESLYESKLRTIFVGLGIDLHTQAIDPRQINLTQHVMNFYNAVVRVNPQGTLFALYKDY